jgi:hypothetical protein
LMLLSIIDGSFQELWVPLHNFFGFQLQQHRQSLRRVLYFVSLLACHRALRA